MNSSSPFSSLCYAFLKKTLNLCEKKSYIEAYESIKLVPEKELANLNKPDAQKICLLFYIVGKLRYSKQSYNEALAIINRAHNFNNQDRLILERTSLLKKLVGSLQDVHKKEDDYDTFCRELGVVSQKCKKESNFSCLQHLICLNHIIPSRFNLQLDRKNIAVLFLGHYHPYRKDDKWSNIIRHFKSNCTHDYAKALSMVLREYLADNDDITCKVDFIIPIPPDPIKYVKRGNAPTDLLEDSLRKQVAIPSYRYIMRDSGCNTREAKESEIDKCYFINEHGEREVKDRNILLLDDVSTRGHTIRACSKLLFNAGANDVSCIILGKTGGT